MKVWIAECEDAKALRSWSGERKVAQPPAVFESREEAEAYLETMSGSGWSEVYSAELYQSGELPKAIRSLNHERRPQFS